MISVVEEKGKSATKRKRSLQQRAEETRAALIATAVEQFSSVGYDGVSVRSLETKARVQRGAVGYHFESKETLWKFAADHLMERMIAHFQPLEATIKDLDIEARIRTSIAAFVRFSSHTPEFSRLMSHEGRQQSWRLDYLVNSFVKERRVWIEQVVGLPLDPHVYYILVGASTFIFDVEHECRALFDIDPTSDEFIREHAARVADLLVLHLRSSRKLPPE